MFPDSDPPQQEVGRLGRRKNNDSNGAWACGGTRIFTASATSNCRVCACLLLTVGQHANRDTDLLSTLNLGLDGKLFDCVDPPKFENNPKRLSVQASPQLDTVSHTYMTSNILQNYPAILQNYPAFYTTFHTEILIFSV